MRYRFCTRQASEGPGKNCIGRTTEAKSCGNPCQAREGKSHCKQGHFSLIIILKCVGVLWCSDLRYEGQWFETGDLCSQIWSLYLLGLGLRQITSLMLSV